MSFDLSKALEKLRKKAELENRKMITSEKINQIRRQQIKSVIDRLYLTKMIPRIPKLPVENDVLPFPLFERLVVPDDADLSQCTLAEAFRHVRCEKIPVDLGNLFIRGDKGDLVCRLTTAAEVTEVADWLVADRIDTSVKGAACYSSGYVPGPVARTKGAICFVRGNPLNGDAIVINVAVSQRNNANIRSYIASVTRTTGGSPLENLLRSCTDTIHEIIKTGEQFGYKADGE